MKRELPCPEFIQKLTASCLGGKVMQELISDEGSWAPHRITSDAARRQTPRSCYRTQLRAEVNLRRPGHHNFRVTVFDASPCGCKVEYIDRPQLEEKLFVKFDGLEPLRANVRWIGQSEAGLQFDRPIHPAVFQLLVRRIQDRRAP